MYVKKEKSGINTENSRLLVSTLLVTYWLESEMLSFTVIVFFTG